MVTRIKSDTEEQYTKIISEARKQAESIISEANQKASSIVSQAKTSADRQVVEERQRSVASAHLDSKRKLLEARDSILRAYEDQARSYLDQFVQSPEYKKFLIRSVKEGVAEIGGDAIVQVSARDRALLEDEDASYTISPKPLTSKGGALVMSKDGKRKVDNTVDSIFNDRREELRLKLAQQIFGK
jgi:vacuolar-type H+-ATPase subunit E/Vma4